MAPNHSNDPVPPRAADRPIDLPRPIGRARAAIPALVFAATLGVLVDPPRVSGNVWSRYMTIESIVERGTLRVDDSPYLGPSGSPDLAKFDGRLYSDKPPVLPALGAAVYGPMHRAGYRMFDLRSPRDFVASFGPVNRALVVLLIALPSALALYGLRRILQAVDVARWLSDLLTIGFGASSLLLTYGVTFNNHSVAAGLLTMAFAVVLLGPSRGRGGMLRSGTSGVLAGLAATIDLPAGGAMWLGLLCWTAVRSRRAATAYAIGSASPLLLHCVLQSLVTGSPLPVEMYPESLSYEGSYWATEIGTYEETIPRGEFLVELLVGPQGWLTVTPILAFSPIGVALTMLRRRDAMRAGAIVVAVVTVVLLGYYSFGVRRTDYSGQSFGVRHLLPISPLAFAYAAASLQWLRLGIWRIVFVASMLIGGVYAVEGMEDPWSRIERRSDLPLRVVGRFVLYPWSSYRR
ncbi:hypothetical protein [Tautonia plasticadhaerens]|uniref:Glycosyltransferase RgtA/B/C/D-like domain-containing protein n=1 Tax=Tautonia plasticadhaerens TaxID=2527974 RepID=A0A518GYF8_9BACT|nr:hypothetical protein [Tautonia plasticadhaerens]QDV33624.1 hypothetical protein ElP_15000 [Tautonia plasticadhaerens]